MRCRLCIIPTCCLEAHSAEKQTALDTGGETVRAGPGMRNSCASSLPHSRQCRPRAGSPALAATTDAGSPAYLQHSGVPQTPASRRIPDPIIHCLVAVHRDHGHAPGQSLPSSWHVPHVRKDHRTPACSARGLSSASTCELQQGRCWAPTAEHLPRTEAAAGIATLQWAASSASRRAF